jgi:Mlc titration factor MtfA (ptsG expression regulator)
MGIAVAIIAYEYFKYKKANSITLKVAQQSPRWKKIKQILEDNFSYYKNLPEDLKPDFVLRTYKFMKQCNWISPGQPAVELHQKVLISASASQLTFGLNDFSFGRFRTILVHQDAYYNRLTKRYHRGEVNQAGVIVLSWKYFEEGYADEVDRINLGLHEMAHALDLALHLSNGRRYNIHRLMEKFRHSAFEQMIEMRHNANSFFRSYASTNAREFFSVAVEHFFEAPFDFREQLPELYQEMCMLLNQDPCNKVFRGFKSPHSTLYSNTFDLKYKQAFRPQIVLNPNINLVIPFITFSLLFALLLPIISTIVKHWSMVTTLSLSISYLIGIYLIYNTKANTLEVINEHILTKKYLFNSNVFTIHLKNIANISFTYMLTFYRVDVAYFESEEIRTKSYSLYFSPANIKKLERLLLQQDIKIKHNNKWLNKESAKSN